MFLTESCTCNEHSRTVARVTLSNILLVLALTAALTTTSRNAIAQSTYTWNNVRIVAGGFITGIVYHPNVQNLVYARTDIGGLYRSTDGGTNWVPLLDWVNWSNWGYSGVLSVALDPQNANTVYAAVGGYTNSWDPNNGAYPEEHRPGQHVDSFRAPVQDWRQHARSRQWRAPGSRSK
jgi:hypothetical protein